MLGSEKVASSERLHRGASAESRNTEPRYYQQRTIESGPSLKVMPYRREREAIRCNSRKLRGMNSTGPHLKRLTGTFIGRLMEGDEA